MEENWAGPSNASFVYENVSYSVNEFLNLKVSKDSFLYEIQQFVKDWMLPKPFIQAQTSGTTGKPKSLLLFKRAMHLSASKTALFFDLPPGSSALLAMPIHYIAGKMQVVRTLVNHWVLHIVMPSSTPLFDIREPLNFAPLAPNQVIGQMQFLYKIDKLLIGGSPISHKLWETLSKAHNHVYQSFGATETVSHFAIRKIKGVYNSTFYECLEGITVSLCPENTLTIHAKEITGVESLQTNDVAVVKNSKNFQWLGRADNVIISGGIKIHPESEEQKIMHAIPFPFVFVGLPDSQLNEKLVMVVETTESTVSLEQFRDAFSAIERYKRPKELYVLPEFPKTSSAKIQRNTIKNQLMIAP